MIRIIVLGKRITEVWLESKFVPEIPSDALKREVIKNHERSIA